MTRLCKCGCGSELPEKNKGSYKWGHKSKPGGGIAGVVTMTAETPEEDGLEVYMTNRQIGRVWSTLPLRLRAIAILSALNYEEPNEPEAEKAVA